MKPTAPVDPQYASRLAMIENILAMWRDFPTLRLGQFLVNAGCSPDKQELIHSEFFYLTDEKFERRCFHYWVKHSGKASEEQKRVYL